jgi:uncharacterized protein
VRELLVAVVASMLVAFAPAAARAAEVPIPPSPTTWVTDTASLLTPSTRDALDARLASYNRATGHQVIVWIGTTTGDTPLEDWTIRAFTAWKVGRKGLDDGVALFIFTQDRKARIEVGYGMEGTLTDAIASGIIRNQIAPSMRAGDGDGAVTAGVSAILATIGGENGATPKPYEGDNGSDQSGLWVIVVVVLFFLVFTIIRARAGRYYTIGSGPIFFGGGWGGGSGGGSWGGGGGGGFSGGGGMGGGGGASGGW